MKSRIPVGLVMMLAALVLSLVPAATVSIQPAAALSTCDWAQFVVRCDCAGWHHLCSRHLVYQDLADEEHRHLHLDHVLLTGLRIRETRWVAQFRSICLTTWLPGQTVDLPVNGLTAPNAAGHYIGYWQFKNAAGALFGIGSNGDRPWWVEINVSVERLRTGCLRLSSPTICSATWYSSAGNLPCPGTDGDFARLRAAGQPAAA